MITAQDAVFPYHGGGTPCQRCHTGNHNPTIRLPVCPGLVATYGTGVWLCYSCAVRLPGCVIAVEGVPVWHVRPTWEEEWW